MAYVQRFATVVLARVALWLAVLFALFPILWMILSSFKPADLVQAIPPVWSFTPTLANYNEVLNGTTSLGQLITHSITVAGSRRC